MQDMKCIWATTSNYIRHELLFRTGNLDGTLFTIINDVSTVNYCMRLDI